MRLKNIVSVTVALGVGVFLIVGCEEDVPGTTRPKVAYLDQTFSLLVRDGNHTGNDVTGWDHDGAAVCTLDWNGDASGDAGVVVPVTYVYNDYPLIDGVAESLGAKGGDFYVWESTPWTAINTSKMVGDGSGVTKVEAKAIYTYVNPPRIWFLFRWEDPSHTIQPVSSQQPTPRGGTHHYYWLQAPNQTLPGEGFMNGRQYESREDWLALVWSTWFLRNTANPNQAPDPNGYNWEFVETVPGFQANGVDVCKGSGDIVYRTPSVNTSQAPYNQVGYPGPYCDLWFFSASRTNYTAAGGWSDDEAAYAFDCSFGTSGFNYPEEGSVSNPNSLDEWLPFDSGIEGITPNGGFAALPTYQAPNDPSDNPPGPHYLWSSDLTALPFALTGPWKAEGGARIPGWLHRPALGSASDIVCRITWQQPNRELYPPWEGTEKNPHADVKTNEYGKDWYYTLEIEREIGTTSKIDPTEDVLLGIFSPHPGE